MAQIERLAAVRLPDVGMVRDKHDDHVPDGRIAMAWKDGDREIFLDKDCLISFQDKFFTIDEMSVILHAVNKTQPRYPSSSAFLMPRLSSTLALSTPSHTTPLECCIILELLVSGGGPAVKPIFRL